MSTPFLSEIRIFSFNFAPKGWAMCNGQLLPINQSQALFALLGTTFGGNGQTNFALPDYRGRVPIHVGNGHVLGEQAGQTEVTINQTTMPQHMHVAQAYAADSTTFDPTGNLLGNVLNGYAAPANLTTLSPTQISNFGGSQPHTNMQPYLTLNFCIALQGIFPSQN
ncbi:MAG: phage tail protein [Sphingomonadales bacterium]|nr:MAG: phage tail protein [Sphingomonadales bacterium]